MKPESGSFTPENSVSQNRIVRKALAVMLGLLMQAACGMCLASYLLRGRESSDFLAS